MHGFWRDENVILIQFAMDLCDRSSQQLSVKAIDFERMVKFRRQHAENKDTCT